MVSDAADRRNRFRVPGIENAPKLDDFVAPSPISFKMVYRMNRVKITSIDSMIRG
jgi:hypothetical protein